MAADGGAGRACEEVAELFNDAEADLNGMLVKAKDCVHNSSYQILAWSTGTRDRAENEIRYLEQAVRVVEKMEGDETIERGTETDAPEDSLEGNRRALARRWENSTSGHGG